MINLIPPSAKKSIAFEYWKRVAAVWLALVSCAFVILSVFLLPTHIALRSEIGYLEETVSAGSARVSNYDISSTELIAATNQARLLLDNATTTIPSDLITALTQYAGSNVALNNFQFVKLTSTPSITLAGLAATRQDLAQFRDAVAADARFATVDLPISNLIKDKDLLFSMEITLATSTRL
ncbi:hypothetical protein K2P47_02200 [Patescibacteria group bacterium]|nr:hypothetical protein [Patescibacteria group bacterium]